MFGGFKNFETMSTIEIYNLMLDKWTMMTIKLPVKIAKYGLAKIDDSQIIIAGGLYADSSTNSATASQTTEEQY